jgi:S-DNA-T family DNA segregation ATPase FtsK/SpoIIIE
VQRQLRIGYNRAARLIEQMERAGLISPMQSNGNREILIPGGE